MPAFITHELFGTQLFYSLDEEIQELLERNPSPYFWGLQGPDLLFFRDAVLGRSVLPKYGSIMHRYKTDELFTALSVYLNLHRTRAEYETLAAYIMGFAAHYCLDREAHPYIYFKQMQKERILPPEESKGVHNRIESDIDTALYEMKKGRSISRYRPAVRLLGNEKEYEIIANLYVTILWEVYGIKVKAAEVIKCFNDTKFLMRLAVDRTGGILRLTGAAEALLARPNIFSQHIRRAKVSEDVLNLDGEQWFNLDTPEKSDNRSFLQIFHLAVYRAADMAGSLYNCSQHNIVYEAKNLKSFDNGSAHSLPNRE